MSRRHITGWISLIQLLCVVVGAPLFIFWGTWLGAMSREEAIVKYPDFPLPEPCDAVIPGRGILRRWEYGTIAQHPWRFALCSAGVAATFGTLAYTVRLSERSPQRPRDARFQTKSATIEPSGTGRDST